MVYHLVPILVATLVSYIVGSLWYLVLGKPWRAALGWVEGAAPYRPRPVELVVALIGQLVMATALGVLIVALAVSGILVGAGIGAAIWLGFVLPSLATNVVFQRRAPALLPIDGLHWLLILAIQGAIRGGFMSRMVTHLLTVARFQPLSTTPASAQGS